MIIVIALTATGTFISVSYSIAYGWRLAKYGMLVFGATFGLFGLATAALILLSYLNSAHSFGIPYLSPLAPLDTRGLWRDSMLRQPWWGALRRLRPFTPPKRIR
ncbi:MAG: spore germination protein [Bacillota bacterium]